MQKTKFALLGSGRLARHLQFYFHHLQLDVVYWSRNADPRFNTYQGPDRLTKTLRQATHVLLAVSDSALPELKAAARQAPRLVHFSGATVLDGVAAAHPLMTFGDELEAPEWYARIPFVIDEGDEFAELLPGVPNPHRKIRRELRPLYHALCSLAGNSTYLLWRKIGREFADKLGVPESLLAPFLHQVVDNALTSPGIENFTGPVARGDWATVDRHLHALSEIPALDNAYRQYLRLALDSGIHIPREVL